MVNPKHIPGQEQMLMTSVNGTEVPVRGVSDVVGVHRADQELLETIAASGDRRNDGHLDPRPHSDIVTEDMGLYRDVAAQPVTPVQGTGRVYELSGRAKGRLSDYNNPLTRAQILRGMAPDEIAEQASVNAEGRQLVDQMNRQPTLQEQHPDWFDPTTGRAIIGAAASEPVVPSVEAPEVPEPTWAQGFVAGIKATLGEGRQNDHKSRNW